MANFSRIAFFICAFSIVVFGTVFYPRWNQTNTEATIGWDVSGYYSYLPATFIYADLKKAEFLDVILAKYHPTPDKIQGFQHPSGNFVFKYPLGQALQFLPWFMLGHTAAYLTGFPTDGFSLPYQAAISWGSLLVALLGLWVMRRVLQQYFSETTVGVSLLLITLGSNYLNYASIDYAMTHNWLFTCYALLVYSTIRFNKSPSMSWALAIGSLCGWATITRPSEIIILSIPILWGIQPHKGGERLQFIIKHAQKYFASSLAFVSVVFLQLAYWKFVTGEWLVYSYENQGFSWRHPHILDVLFSYRAGWLIYSPILLFAIIGLFFLPKRTPTLYFAIFTYFLTNLYIVSAWDIWWYGGSLGMRALVQSYAVLLIPFAAFVEWSLKVKGRALAVFGLSIVFIWMNSWWTIQAHRKNGLFASEQMTKSYFWKVIGKSENNSEWLKLLDTDEIFTAENRYSIQVLYKTGFENDTTNTTETDPISGNRSLLLTKEQQYSPETTLGLVDFNKDWVRISCRIACEEKEWEYWKMTQLIARFKNGETTVKESAIRLQRHVENTETKYLYLDIKAPSDRPFDKLGILFWNGESNKKVRVDDLQVESFNSYQ